MKEIAAALIEAQKELPLVIAKESRGHHSAYASFEVILERVRPILSKHDLALVQSGDMFDGQALCRTRLIHKSGEVIEGVWPIIEAKDAKLHPAQAMGQGWTYARRYTLAAILGIGTGDLDVDASEPPNEQKQVEQQQQEQQPTFREWFDAQIKHYREVLGNEFDAEVKRLGVNDLSAIKTQREAKTLINGLKNAVDKHAAEGTE